MDQKNTTTNGQSAQEKTEQEVKTYRVKLVLYHGNDRSESKRTLKRQTW